MREGEQFFYILILTTALKVQYNMVDLSRRSKSYGKRGKGYIKNKNKNTFLRNKTHENNTRTVFINFIKEYRLYKYSKRGFAVAVPGLEVSQIEPTLHPYKVFFNLKRNG